MRTIISEAYFICSIINNLSILCIVYVLARGYFYRKVNLSIGSFKIRRKDFSVQNITNIVSMKFYDGGEVPSIIRKEILYVTTPKIRDLSRTDSTRYTTGCKKRHKKYNRHKKTMATNCKTTD